MIHDIRTPLQTITFNMFFSKKVLKSGENIDKLKEFIKRTEDGVEMITSLLNGLSHTKTNKNSTTSLKKIMEHCFEIIQNNNKSYIYNEYENVIVTGDENNIKRILTNITNNAIKYTTDNIIRFSFQDSPKKYTISISNKTNLKDTDNIFLELHRLSNVNDTNGEGLGLSICHELIEKNSGMINVEINDDEIFFILEFEKSTINNNLLNSTNAKLSKP